MKRLILITLFLVFFLGNIILGAYKRNGRELDDFYEWKKEEVKDFIEKVEKEFELMIKELN